MRHFPAICRQCREHLADLVSSAVASEPAQSPEAITDGQTEKPEYSLEASEQSVQKEEISITSNIEEVMSLHRTLMKELSIENVSHNYVHSESHDTRSRLPIPSTNSMK